jgi:hypothetical protein
LEDYAVVYFGSAVFKIIRLLLVAIFSVHFFACIFYRVKDISAESQEDVTDFYESKNIATDVIPIIELHVFDSQLQFLCHSPAQLI